MASERLEAAAVVAAPVFVVAVLSLWWLLGGQDCSGPDCDDSTSFQAAEEADTLPTSSTSTVIAPITAVTTGRTTSVLVVASDVDGSTTSLVDVTQETEETQSTSPLLPPSTSPSTVPAESREGLDRGQGSVTPASTRTTSESRPELVPGAPENRKPKTTEPERPKPEPESTEPTEPERPKPEPESTEPTEPERPKPEPESTEPTEPERPKPEPESTRPTEPERPKPERETTEPTEPERRPKPEPKATEPRNPTRSGVCNVVVVEAESMPVTGAWRIAEDGRASGGRYITWEGLSPSRNNRSPADVMTVNVRIGQPGEWRFVWAMRQPDNVAGDKGNDAWVGFPNADRYGPTSGGTYPGMIKVFGRGSGGFDHNGKADVSHSKSDLAMVFNESGTYKMNIGGRSHGFQLDRVVLHHSSIKRSEAVKGQGRRC